MSKIGDTSLLEQFDRHSEQCGSAFQMIWDIHHGKTPRPEGRYRELTCESRRYLANLLVCLRSDVDAEVLAMRENLGFTPEAVQMIITRVRGNDEPAKILADPTDLISRLRDPDGDVGEKGGRENHFFFRLTITLNDLAETQGAQIMAPSV